MLFAVGGLELKANATCSLSMQRGIGEFEILVSNSSQDDDFVSLGDVIPEFEQRLAPVLAKNPCEAKQSSWNTTGCL